MWSDRKDDFKRAGKCLFWLRPRSLGEYFPTIIASLILILSLPIFISGILLMEGIIKDYGQSLLKNHLNDLVKDVDRRYKTLKRVGLEDSIKHLEEIKRISLEEFSKYRFGKSGRVFVVKRDGELLLANSYINKGRTDLSDFLDVLKETQKTKDLLEFQIDGTSLIATFIYYPRWKSFIGISIKKSELFAAKNKFIFINGITVLVTILISLLFFKNLQNTVIFPILRLSRFADCVTKGQYEVNLPGEFKFELELLRNSFLRMLSSLREKIEESNRQLKIISDREAKLKTALQALKNEKERLSITLKSIGDGVITTDTNGKIELMNEVAERLTGWKWQDAYGRHLSEVFRIFDEKTGNSFPDPVAKVINKGKVVELSNNSVLISKDGTKRLIVDSGAPIRDVNGNILGVVLVFRDVTQRRKMEKELLNMEKLRAVGILAGGIAHDFNNILTAILGSINLVSLSKNLSNRDRDILKQAESACMRATSLTKQLLTFAKGGAPIKETQRLEDIVIDSAKFILRGSGIKLDIDISKDLWWVDVDKGQFSQVIQNIILNAKEAMKDKGTIRISMKNLGSYRPTGHKKERDWVLVTIKDSGPGIPEDIISNIFEPYFTTKETGSGLGLAICHSIVTKHDGVIEVCSREGEGTTFRILLPRSMAKEGYKQVEEQEKEPLKVSGSPKRILLVDDEDIVREMAKEMLKGLGYDVVDADSATSALKIFKDAIKENHPFDCVITDLTMPGEMGGKELMEALKELDKKVRIILSSGYGDTSFLADYEKYGFSAILTKPYRLTELDNTIRRVIA